MPPSLVSRCIGISGDECEKLEVDHSNIEETGNDVPNKVIGSWFIYSEGIEQNRVVLDAVRKAKLANRLKREVGTSANGEMVIPALRENLALDAQVHWELWTNGQTFSVFKASVVR